MNQQHILSHVSLNRNTFKTRLRIDQLMKMHPEANQSQNLFSPFQYLPELSVQSDFMEHNYCK